ncbi:CMP-N-acetylneuraminate-beta-galactosamide-alpha-2,3-sialyltransferase 1-like [Acanthochromis polyacanthus]|uniref:CMP-N-acetylneuraminate-beta-galactosamide- alpha-2,3-sialyltransferase 1-like n=1 Tax=Acanthochromis polyacanthus TaxID=80966 RepID=UPI0022348727|nr:CMP-N-acetylneuraminate-beta-galactosamide-alpha-2,3-sialyltransferase 1-like [Acanthochromis polyacanthus]
MKSKFKVFILLLFLTGVSLFIRTHFNLTVWFHSLQQSPCACEKCLSEDKLLLMQSFTSSVDPFLSVNYNLSEDAFNWWKRLQNERRSFSTYKTTVERLFQMFPPTPDLREPSPDCCRTCAVVGNSVNLKRSHYGPLIDFHDVVIRMNFGRINGYEEDVGTRTTHRVMYPESAVDLDNTTHLVLFPFKIQDLEWLIMAFTTGFTGKSYAAVKSKVQANKDLVMVVNPAFMRYVHDIWLDKKGEYPSTGFMALVLALHICDQVRVFGFGADSDGNWSHYWEKLKNKKLRTGQHPGQHEYHIIQQLAEEQKIHFFTGH